MTRRECNTCAYGELSVHSAECTGCAGRWPRPKWTPKASPLRDEFAKAALPAIIAKVETQSQPLAARAESIAECAYIIADAMVKARGE